MPTRQPREQELEYALQRPGEARRLVKTRGSFPQPFFPRHTAAASVQPPLHLLATLSQLGLCQAKPLGSGCCCSSRSRSRWLGCYWAEEPGRAIMTHPIGIRRLHWLFIGPRQPQKALQPLFFSLPLSGSLALAQRRRGSKRNAVNKPVGPSATFPSTAKLLPLCYWNHLADSVWTNYFQHTSFSLWCSFLLPFQLGFLSLFAFFPLSVFLQFHFPVPGIGLAIPWQDWIKPREGETLYWAWQISPVPAKRFPVCLFPYLHWVLTLILAHNIFWCSPDRWARLQLPCSLSQGQTHQSSTLVIHASIQPLPCSRASGWVGEDQAEPWVDIATVPQSWVLHQCG